MKRTVEIVKEELEEENIHLRKLEIEKGKGASAHSISIPLTEQAIKELEEELEGFMRYFIFHYRAEVRYSQILSVGVLPVAAEGFPTKTSIIEKITKDMVEDNSPPPINVEIVSWNEFSNKEEFNHYHGYN